MGKLQEKIESASEQLKKLGVKVDAELLEKVARGLGPALYKSDSSLVAVSSKTELETVKKNFAVKKLGASDAEADAAIEKVSAQMKAEKRKQRVNFYYLIVKELGKESIYA